MTQDELYEWGKWVRDDDDGLGYKSPWLNILRDHVEISSSAQTPNITDDRAMHISQAVTQLYAHSPVLGDVLSLYYIYGYSLKAIAREYLTPLEYPGDSKRKVSQHTASNLLNRATGIVEGLILNNS